MVEYGNTLNSERRIGELERGKDFLRRRNMVPTPLFHS